MAIQASSPVRTAKLRDAYRARQFDGLADILASDAILDATVPGWRFQRQGVDDIIAQFKEWPADPVLDLEWREYQAEFGVVVQAAERREQFYSRYVWLIHMDGDKIRRIELYCPGDWDTETQERWRREAPMVEQVIRS